MIAAAPPPPLVPSPTASLTGASFLPLEDARARPVLGERRGKEAVTDSVAPVAEWLVEGRVRLAPSECGARVEVETRAERRGRSLHVTPAFRILVPRGGRRPGDAPLQAWRVEGETLGRDGCERWLSEGVRVRFRVPAPGVTVENVFVRNVGEVGGSVPVGELPSAH